ncbi:MAG TPA: hypothetical protein ENN43_05275 [bacterium]|nr:hypothetical protein [bacterium]
MLARILVALVILPVLVFLIFMKNPYYFIALAVLAMILALNEVYSMLEKKGNRSFRVMGSVFAAVFCAAAVFTGEPAVYFAVFGIFVIFTYGRMVFLKDIKKFPMVSNTVMPVAYIAMLGSFGIHLRLLPEGSWFIFILMFITYVYDGAAYFAGSFFGRHKLIPEISPGKTIEGCIGGLIIATAASVIISFTVLPAGLLGELQLVHILILSVLLSVVGQIGDISASAIKRFSGARNSSNLLPGHGGALDKIDSAVFNAPVLFVYLKFFVLS